MGTLLIKNADVLACMDEQGREIRNGSLFIRDNIIEQVGDTPNTADCVLDMRGHVVLPGLVNTHHHLFQSLTRATPGAQDGSLFDWLRTHYRVWPAIDAAALYTSAKLALAELMLSGCTTCADHTYLFPNDARLDDQIRAAAEMGVRFHPSRGSMTLGESDGGLPPDAVVERDEDVLRDSRRVIESYHDASRYSMCRVAVGPCAPFNVTEALMRDSAALARSYGVLMHTHVAETRDEDDYCLERTGLRPVAYMESLGWVGPDVWWAHAVWPNQREITLMAETGTGVAHCPGSNMRLGSGIAPIRRYLDAGVRVGVAVDGSASNDSGHLLGEVRLAMLLQRVNLGPQGLSAREALRMATVGGAQVLGRNDIGVLAPGMAADVIAIDTRTVEFAGAQADPVAALLFCMPVNVSLSVINGRIVIENGRLVDVDLDALIAQHNAISKRLLAQ